MPTETRGKPQPTPHPDEPWNPGLIRQPSPEPAPTEEADWDEPTYGSCIDDLDVILWQAVPEPDPALQSNSPLDEKTSSTTPIAPVPDSAYDRGKQPKTAEVFKNLGAHVGDPEAAGPESGARELTSPSEAEAGGQSGLAEQPGGPGTSRHAAHVSAGIQESEAEGDDHGADSRIAWFLLVLLSYSSAVTLALAWVLWTGMASRSTERPAARASQSSGEPLSKSAESEASLALPPIPDENLTILGKAIRVGDLEITPLEIVATTLQLVRAIDSSDVRDEESESLVLRFKLTNISKDHTFAPLEAALIREQNSPLDCSHIAIAGGGRIRLFPLAVDSEWVIAGQSFEVLKPGETVETVLASEPIRSARPSGEMTWRVRLRIGPYRSDIVGVRFSATEITP